MMVYISINIYGIYLYQPLDSVFEYHRSPELDLEFLHAAV